MIPAFDGGEVLPPFHANDVVGQHGLPRSPYPATTLELVERFATSRERSEILKGLLQYRAALKQIGFEAGIQWIDGSFVENCEAARGRPPGDVDVVSLLYRPAHHAAPNDWLGFIQTNAGLLADHDAIKGQYRCDAYFIDLDIEAALVAQQTAYWFGLFSHQRDSFRWKGMVQLDFMCDDGPAAAELAARDLTW